MNRITELFGTKYPIVQGGMVWCSGWRLAAAVSNAGGLGLLGAGSMHPETLMEHIEKMKTATDKPWGINIPLMYPEIDKIMKIIIDSGVRIVFTSAGSPKKFTPMLHEAGITVAHVVSSSLFARKCEEAGVDAIVAEGFEAGGHNGREETTTMALIPQVRQATSLPLIAAGGIGSGQAVLAAQALGAEGVQIGTLFALAEESSASETFKQKCITMAEGDTMLCLKKLAPTRLVKNSLYNRIAEAEAQGADAETLRGILGHAASKRGIFEGDTETGELEIGQIVSAVKEIRPVHEIIGNIVSEYHQAMKAEPLF
ncbi:MAG: nitronate monooxygenase [Bacteroidales bacterium]|nr:nitronate monooxygenase [Bacteroidales bacterium]MCM1147575.1 nitronate monooxygenase [Bacteroidales bacterium]MCM1206365.1 nitronate monooxygenase [Bacillota bacterium]MCM1509099.1 nitronate monooxygenase [Clostridium sp.]